MKVSIIIPVYNAEKYLRQCLDSLVDQTLDDYEIILVNDGSKDSSEAIIQEYRARYPERINAVTVENGGQGRARNIGMELAQGEYLGFVDSDDWVKPDMFLRLCRAAEREDADVAVCGIENRYDDGRCEFPPLRQGGRAVAAAGSACNKLFRRSAVGDLRFPQGLWYEDFSFSARLLCRACAIAWVDEPLYIYRRGHESTMTNNNALKNLDMLKIMEELEAFFSVCGSREDFEYLVLNHVLLDSINRLSAQKGPDKRLVIKKMREYVHREIPKLSACAAFRSEGRNRRIIMRLNYHGLYRLSRFILATKKLCSS